MLCLLFNTQRDFLGEAILRDGACDRMQLNDAGERELGVQCERWQTTGVPVRKEIFQDSSDGSREVIFYVERVQLRSKEFRHALKSWGSLHEVLVIELGDTLIPMWQRLLQLPLEPPQRLSYLLVLRQTPADLLSDWTRALEEANTLARHEQQAAARSIAVLQKRLASHLERAFVQGA